MTKTPRLALIHATRLAIDPIEKAAAAIWPEVEAISILDEGLSVDRAKENELSSQLHRRIVDLSRYAQTCAADGILFTCSAFGTAIDQACAEAPVPVMKPNEAMFEAAFSYGDRIAIIYTFPPSAEGMEEEFRQEGTKRGSAARLTTYFCDGALAAKRAGDHVRHDQLIAETALGIERADVILLAQFSMAGAVQDVRKQTGIPVLTSPEAAITEIRRRIESKQKG